MKKMKVMTVVGTRPEVIRLARVIVAVTIVNIFWFILVKIMIMN